MADRAALIDRFLARSEWATWDRTEIAGDASARRYERLCDGPRSVILMDAAPEQGEDTARFARIATVLRTNGLNAPRVLAHDPIRGIMVLSDLGVDDFAAWLRHRPGDAGALYSAAVDILVHLSGIAPPDRLTAMTPDVAATMVSIAAEQYGQSAPDDLMGAMQTAMAAHAPVADTLALRDFHAENLMWLPEEDGLQRVGLLDFQDAFVAPAGYDLVSLLRDARRDVAPGLVDNMIESFVEKTGAGPGFRAQFACLGAQRNLRILGVFARLAGEQGKIRYVDLIPRVWANLMLDLAYPALGPLKEVVLDILPPPDPATLERLRT